MRPFDLVPMRVARRVVGGSVAALALLTLSGCQKTVAKAAAAGPDGRRGRVAADERADRGDAQRDHPRPGGRDDPGPRPRVPHRTPFRRGGDGQEGAAPAGDRRGAVPGGPPVGAGPPGRGRRRAPQGRGIQGARGLRGAAGPRPGPAAARPDPGAAEPGARCPGTPDRPRISTRPRPTASGGNRRSRPTAPTSPRPRPTTSSGSPRPRRRSRPPRPPSATPS